MITAKSKSPNSASISVSLPELTAFSTSSASSRTLPHTSEAFSQSKPTLAAFSCMRENQPEIKKELGDVLLHVFFYAKIGSEKGEFDIADVALYMLLSDALASFHKASISSRLISVSLRP